MTIKYDYEWWKVVKRSTVSKTNFMQQNSFQKLTFAHHAKKLPTFYDYRSSIFLDITPCSLVKVN